MNSALSMQDLCMLSYIILWVIFFWEGQHKWSLCREEKHLFLTVESKDTMIGITFMLFYLPPAPGCMHKGQWALL